MPTAHSRYTEALVEVQVGSVLMHAWAEVEHDLVYKPAAGELSTDELAILDELNGLVLAGEIALERLQHAASLRVSRPDADFRNHYELAAYLYEEAARQRLGPEEPVMGRADVLFALLRETELANPTLLGPYVSSLREATEERPLAEQIIDLLVSAKPDLYPRYAELRGESREALGASREASDAEHLNVGKFLNAWIDLEKTVRVKSRRRGEAGPIPFHRLARMIKLSPRDAAELRQLQQLRNQLVHGLEAPPADYLGEATQRVRSLTRKLGRRR